MFKKVGNLWNDSDIEIVSDGKEFYALYGWNGEEYCNCWEVKDENGLERDEEDDREYTFKRVYEEIEEEQYEIIGYEKL